MANRYMEMYSTSLIIREMQIKTSMRYHLIPVRMTVIKKTRNNKCWWEYMEKRTLSYCWWECKLIKPLWKTVWRFLKKLKIELLYDPAIPLLGIYPKEMKTLTQKNICIPMFNAEKKIWKKICPSFKSSVLLDLEIESCQFTSKRKHLLPLLWYNILPSIL